MKYLAMKIKLSTSLLPILLIALLILVLAVVLATVTATPAEPVMAHLATLPPSTPTVTPTPGWWAGTDYEATPTLKKLPGISKPGFQGLAGGGGIAPGKPIKFKTITCPTAGVKITGVETGANGSWNVLGSVTLPNLQYWKIEASVDGKNWLHLYRQNGPASGILSRVNLSTLPGRPAFFRLTAVDRTGNYPTPCTIQMTP